MSKIEEKEYYEPVPPGEWRELSPEDRKKLREQLEAFLVELHVRRAKICAMRRVLQ